MHQRIYCVLGLLVAMASAGSVCSAQVLFSRSTDTISVSGDPALSTQATFEATVFLNSTSYNNAFGAYDAGTIYNAYSYGYQDNRLGIGNGGTGATVLFPQDSTVFYAGSMTTGAWYDLAFVYNGSQERMYVNGTLVGSRSASGNIGSSLNQLDVQVGAIDRDGGINPSFLGEIDSLRISDTARYSGSSYTPVMDDFSDDASTLLLYDFDSLSPGATTIRDLSGNGHTGTFGVGFIGATAPAVLPEPAGIAILVIGATLCFRRQRAKPAAVVVIAAGGAAGG